MSKHTHDPLWIRAYANLEKKKEGLLVEDPKAIQEASCKKKKKKPIQAINEKEAGLEQPSPEEWNKILEDIMGPSGDMASLQAAADKIFAAGDRLKELLVEKAQQATGAEMSGREADDQGELAEVMPLIEKGFGVGPGGLTKKMLETFLAAYMGLSIGGAGAMSGAIMYDDAQKANEQQYEQGIADKQQAEETQARRELLGPALDRFNQDFPPDRVVWTEVPTADLGSWSDEDLVNYAKRLPISEEAEKSLNDWKLEQNYQAAYQQAMQEHRNELDSIEGGDAQAAAEWSEEKLHERAREILKASGANGLYNGEYI